MIHLLGDIHSCFGDLYDMVSDIQDDGPIVQLGDFGMFPRMNYTVPPRKVYWLDGNHEYFPDIQDITEPTEVYPNAVYVPRGTVMELDGRRVGFLGGGESTDRHTRVEGSTWFREESISYADGMRLLENADGGLDILLTHVPPAFVVGQILPGIEILPSSNLVEAVWDSLDRPDLYCGHMHTSFQRLNCTVLGINEKVSI